MYLIIFDRFLIKVVYGKFSPQSRVEFYVTACVLGARILIQYAETW